MQLFRMYWRRTARKPGNILMWMGLPFLFMAIYQAAFGGNSGVPRTSLAIVDQDSSMVSGFVARAFGQGPAGDIITVIEVSGLDAMQELFADEKASAGLIIPKGFGDDLLKVQPITLPFYTNPRHYIGPQIAEGVVSTLAVMGNGLIGIFEMPLGIVGSQMDREQPPTEDEVAALSRLVFNISQDAGNLSALTATSVIVREEESDAEDVSGFGMASLFFPGLIMFGILSVSLSIETRFLTDRLDGVTRRFVTSPVRPAAIVMQQRLYAATFLYIIGIAAGLLGGVVWQIPPNGLATVHAITVALVLFVAGINGTIFALSSSRKAVSAMSSVVMMALLLMGGGFFPAEFTPEWYQAVSRQVPTGIANIALTRALTGREVGVSIPLLYGYALLFFGMSVVAGRRRLV
jgi:ABC-type multidrug transport system permease subunit